MGHLRRCSTLAVELKKSGASVIFLCRTADIDLAAELAGIADASSVMNWRTTPEHDAREVARASEELGADATIIDHYRVNAEYQKHLLASGIRWMQFDWNARQPLWADWVLNASPAADEDVYQSLQQREETVLLLGPLHAMLRQDFARWRPRVRFREDVRSILLTFGGGDDRGATVFFLEALRPLEPSVERVVLASSANPRLSDLREWVDGNNDSNVTLLVDDRHLAKRMAEADLAITAGGTTTFETAAMGVPSLIVQLEKNQRPNAEAWQRLGVANDMGQLGSLGSDCLLQQTLELLNNSGLRRSMSCAGRSHVDCLGTRRVSQVLLTEDVENVERN